MNGEREQVLDMFYVGRLNHREADQVLHQLGASLLTDDEKLYAAHLAQAPTFGTASWGNATPSSRDERADSVAYTVDELVRLSAHGVDPAYVDAVREAGYTDLPIDEIIEMHAAEVDPQVLADYHRAGIADLSVAEILELQAHEVDPQDAANLRAAGYAHLPFEQLLELAVHRVDLRYLKVLHDAGMADLPFDTLLACGVHQVDVAGLQAAVRSGQDEPA